MFVGENKIWVNYSYCKRASHALCIVWPYSAPLAATLCFLLPFSAHAKQVKQQSEHQGQRRRRRKCTPDVHTGACAGPHAGICISWRQCGLWRAGEKHEREGQAERNCYTLTITPCHCAPLRGGVQRAPPGAWCEWDVSESGEERCFYVCSCFSLPKIILISSKLNYFFPS